MSCIYLTPVPEQRNGAVLIKHAYDTTNVLTTVLNILHAYEDNVLAGLLFRFVGILYV